MVAKSKGKWVRRNLVERRALLSRFEGSGLGVTAFCQRERISAASFYRWQRESGGGVHRATADDIERASALVDLGALSMQASTSPRLDLRLDLGDGLVLHLVRR
jgi:putative transposase